MGNRDEPRMDELKRLLRRIDSLDGASARAGRPEDNPASVYVGALRGVPAAGSHVNPEANASEPPTKARIPSVYIVAIVSAVVSTLTVLMLMLWLNAPAKRASALPQTIKVAPAAPEPAAPSDLAGQTLPPE